MPICNITGLVQACHATAKSKGWWESTPEKPERTFGDQIALMHSELSEALEEYRINALRQPLYFLWRDGEVDSKQSAEGDGKPEGVAAEFADVLIRIFDTCGRYGIPLEEALEAKMEYNKSRPHRHGGKVI